jgi:HD-GYP domain-containing protein (c-di-GMP phosphodiesterase class II)
MTTDRPYRKGLTIEEALAEIEGGRGTQFDPDIGAEFITMVQSEFLDPAGSDGAIRAA